MEEKEVEMNFPFSLKVLVGVDSSGDNSVAGDETVEQFIGSEIEPVKIAEMGEPYEGNGSSSYTECWVIVQKEQAILITKKSVESCYEYQTQSIEYSWEAFVLPEISKARLQVGEKVSE